MEVNAFRALVNVTTKGVWIEKEDFVKLTYVCFAECGMDYEWLEGKKFAYVLAEMENIGFIELDEDDEMVRIVEHWYGED